MTPWAVAMHLQCRSRVPRKSVVRVVRAAMAAMLTMSLSLALRPTIWIGLLRPTSIGPITVQPPSSCSILVEIEADHAIYGHELVVGAGKNLRVELAGGAERRHHLVAGLLLELGHDLVPSRIRLEHIVAATQVLHGVATDRLYPAGTQPSLAGSPLVVVASADMVQKLATSELLLSTLPLFQYTELYMLTMSVSGAPAMALLKMFVCVTRKAVW